MSNKVKSIQSANNEIDSGWGDTFSNLIIFLIPIILPLVGFIMGGVYVTRADQTERKRGALVLSMSLLASIFWGIAWVLMTHHLLKGVAVNAAP